MMHDVKPAEAIVDDTKSRGKDTVVVGVLIATVVVAIAMFTVDDRTTIGALSVAIMLLLLVANVPVGVALIVASLLGIFAQTGWGPVEGTLTSIPYAVTASWSLSVIPLFVFMGLLMWKSGATEHLYGAVRAWMGWMPGGIAATTTGAGAGLAAVSGSTIGITYAVTRIGIPEMLKAGYDKSLATGSVIVAGTLGQLIPPSVLLVVYAGLANVSVGQQLMAGVLPGILLALAYLVTILVISIARPNMAPRGDSGHKIPLSTKLARTGPVVPVFALIALVVGGLYTGIFTATEAGAFGAFGGVILTCVYAGLKKAPAVIFECAVLATSATAGIFLMLVGADLFSRMVARSGLTTLLTNAISDIGMPRMAFIFTLVLFYLILGMFIEPMTMIILTLPVLTMSLDFYDIDLIWFGIFIVLMAEIGAITPPVGVLSFIVHRIVQSPDIARLARISLGDVFKGALFFVPSALAVVVVLIYFPGLATALPNAMSGG